MTENTAAKNVVEDVTSRMFRSNPVKRVRSRWQKLFFWMAVGTVLCMGIFLFLFTSVTWPQPQWLWRARLTMLSVVIFVLSCGMVLFIDIPTEFRLEQTEFPRLVAAFDEELGLIAHLARTYERHDLEYALDRMSLVVTQFRSTVAVTIGALEKVGILPLVIAGYFSPTRVFKGTADHIRRTVFDSKGRHRVGG